MEMEIEAIEKRMQMVGVFRKQQMKILEFKTADYLWFKRNGSI